jgi:hypothetical protein
MSKKIRDIIVLLMGYLFGILFLQTMYSRFYYTLQEYTLPQGIIPHPSTAYLKINAFIEPTNLSIFISILFFAGMLMVIFFESV